MSSQFTVEQYQAAADFIQNKHANRPKIGLILGSGLSVLADQISQPTVIPYAGIPHFPTSTVAGHAGRLVLGELSGVQVCVMQGRFHFYEGYTMQQVTLPIRVMKLMGINTLILTNAAGGLNPDFETGDLMLIEDQINLIGMSGNNPLCGPNIEAFGPRFPAMNRTYTRHLRDLAKTVATELGITLHQGVYTALSGPNFETPAEIRFLRTIGTDAVGMSTAPEALVAHHTAMEVLAISTITNMAVDTLESSDEPTHEEVVEAGKIIVPKLSRLLLGLIKKFA